MNKKKSLVWFSSIIYALIFVSGCGYTPLTDSEKKMHEDQQLALIACHEAQEVKERADAEEISCIPKDQVAFVKMFRDQQDFMGSVLAQITGKSNDPCDPTTIFDVKVVELEEKNQTARKVSGDATSVSKWGLGAGVVNNAVDKIGNGFRGKQTTINGDHNKTTSDSYNPGSGNTTDGDGGVNVISDNKTDEDNTRNEAPPEGELGEMPEE